MAWNNNNNDGNLKFMNLRDDVADKKHVVFLSSIRESVERMKFDEHQNNYRHMDLCQREMILTYNDSVDANGE